MNKKNNLMGWSFISPYIILSIIFFLLPLIWSFWLAFTDWNMMSPTIDYVGFKNFKIAIMNPRVWAAAKVSYKFMIIFVPSVFIISLGIAKLVDWLPKYKGLYSVLFFLPYLSSGVVTSLIVKGVLSYNSPLNTWLRTSYGKDIKWLETPTLALSVVAFMVAWKMSGYYALILHSGLNSVDKEIYEAADLDGVGKTSKFFKITIPLIYPAIYTVLTMAIGVSFGIFTEVFQLTGGGPNLATNTWQMEIFTQAFVNLKSGYASSIALISSIVTFISITILQYIIKKWGKHYGWE